MRRLIITFFYTGLSPVAPGTVGSLAASAVLFAWLSFIHPDSSQWEWFLLIALAVACFFSIALGKWAVRHYHRKDPQMFVLDEVAGVCLTNLFLPGIASWKTIGIAFVAFRIFDVTKPPPARQLEKLPAGWGILMDDLAAAVFANLLCQILLRMIL
jgi:phosphatidylglycerophosphatase A